MNSIKLVAAFLIAPATPALIAVVPALLFDAPTASVWSLFVLTSVVTYAHAIVLGLPAAWLLSRKIPLTMLRVIVAAFLIGALPFGCLMLYQESTIPPGAGYEQNGVVLRDDGHITSAGLRNAVVGVLQSGGLGAVTGLVWWLIARRKTQG